MAYSVVNCAHNQVCTHCPSRIDCDMRKIFYNEDEYFKRMDYAHTRAESSARARGFSESDCTRLANECTAMMDHKRTEELKLYPQYSRT